MNTQDQPTRVLIVDDDEHIRRLCERVAVELGFSCQTSANGRRAADLMADQEFDIVLTDVCMPDGDGFELFEHVKAHAPQTAVAMMTGYGTIEQAVSAFKAGVQDYLTKPFELEALTSLLRDLAHWHGRSDADLGLASDTEGAPAFYDIVGASEAMKDVFRRIMRSAAVDSTVLIQGESGTGKELVARAIHECSPRAGEPFMPLDCGALSGNLVESELFGHVKGAYTNAFESSPGILKGAEGGTVFLDEIGELPVPMQAKFLRALQEKEVRPVGAVKHEPFHARVIAATNRELEQDIVAGRFRKDLFYRLHVVPILVPPLRKRREDIPLLVDVFLKKHSPQRAITVTDEAMGVLMQHDWPGNVRELENCVERACVMNATGRIGPVDILVGAGVGGGAAEGEPVDDGGIRPLVDYEEEAIVEALAKTGYNKAQAAKGLGIAIPTLYAKMKKYGIPLSPE